MFMQMENEIAGMWLSKIKPQTWMS